MTRDLADAPHPASPDAAAGTHSGESGRTGWRARVSDQLRRWWGLAVPLVAAAGGGWAAAAGDQGSIGGWGLVQALPWPYFAALAMVALSFLAQLFGRLADRPSTGGVAGAVLVTHLVCLVFLLHGAPALLEEEPRFATAWLHAGFTEQILTHGEARPEVDARFNWPGFFVAAATVAGAAGIEDPVTLLRWAPVVAVMLYLPPLYLIARHLTSSSSAVWLGLFVFLGVNWVGQDYFAPQTAGFVFYLWCLTLLVLFFRQGDQLPLPRRVAAWRSRTFDGRPDLPVSGMVRSVLLVVVLLLVGAIALSHQLTPMMLTFVTSALVLAGRLRLLTLPVLALLITFGWLSLGATTYWVGHLDDIFGNFGDVEAVAGGVEGRVGGSPEHTAVVRLRMLFSASVWAGAAAAVWFLWTRRQRPPITLAVLAAAPFGALVQPYGGEALMRIFLFSCPFACFILAEAAVTLQVHRALRAVVPVLALGVLGLFLVTRYGNESYEQVRPAEVRAVATLYDTAPVGSNIVSPVSQVPWRFTRAADYDYGRTADTDAFLDGDLEAIRNPLGDGDEGEAPATYLLVTTSQKIYATEAFGQPQGWFDDVVRPLLTPENGYRLVYRNPDALIYEFTEPQR